MTMQQIFLPGGYEAQVDLAAGTGHGIFGDFTFTPGSSLSDITAGVGSLQDLHLNGGITLPPPGTIPGSGNGGTSGAGGGTTGSASGVQSASITNTLRQYGLDALIPMVDRWVRDGLTWPEIEAQLYDPTTAAGKVVDQQYPEVRLMREQGSAPITITQIKQYRDTASAILRQAGMPSTFYDQPSDFTHFILKGVDAQELQQRVGIAVDWAQTQPAEVRNQLEALYGVDEGGIAAYALDPNKALPALQRQGAAAAVSGAASRTGFGALNQTEAERLAALGVDYGAASRGFNALDRSSELFNPLTGEGGDVIGRQQQLGAAFENDAQAQAAVDRAAGNRTGVFKGGGGVASNKEGFAGLGVSSR